MVPARAGLQLEPGIERIIERSEDAERLAHLALVDDRRRSGGGRCAKVEALYVELLIEVEQARLIAEPAVVVGRDPHFLGELVEARNVVLALRRKRDEARCAIVGEARTAERAAEAAIDVAAALKRAVPIAGDRVERDRPEVIFNRAGDVACPQFLEINCVGANFVAIKIAAVGTDQIVGPGADRICPEHPGIAVQVTQLAGQANGQRVGRLELDLGAQRDIVIAFQIVVTRLVEIVDPVIAMLPHARHADRDLVGDVGADRALGTDGRISAIADLGVIAPADRTNGVELDDPGRRIAAEQGALRPAQHLNAVDVERRETLQDRILQDDIVIHQADRLRRVEIEIGVAQAADIEARKGAAERAFDVQAGHASRKAANIRTAGIDRRQRVAIDGCNRQRHVLQIFAAPLGGDDDILDFAARDGLGGRCGRGGRFAGGCCGVLAKGGSGRGDGDCQRKGRCHG